MSAVIGSCFGVRCSGSAVYQEHVRARCARTRDAGQTHTVCTPTVRCAATERETRDSTLDFLCLRLCAVSRVCRAGREPPRPYLKQGFLDKNNHVFDSRYSSTIHA